MRAVTVYRVDYRRKTKDPIGTVLEKRKTERRTTTTTCCGWHGDSSRRIRRTPSISSST